MEKEENKRKVDLNGVKKTIIKNIMAHFYVPDLLYHSI